jgi:hypothetical protein
LGGPSSHEFDVSCRLEKEEALFLKSRDLLQRERRPAEDFAMFLSRSHDSGNGGFEPGIVLPAAQTQ